MSWASSETWSLHLSTTKQRVAVVALDVVNRSLFKIGGVSGRWWDLTIQLYCYSVRIYSNRVTVVYIPSPIDWPKPPRSYSLCASVCTSLVLAWRLQLARRRPRAVAVLEA